VPFLETVGNPVAVSPERGLRAGAQRRCWPVFWCEGRPATPGLLELARTAAFYGGMVAGMGAGLGVGLLRHSRRELVDIGGEVGADLEFALVGIDVRVVSGAEHLWLARRCVFVFNHQRKLDPILIMTLLRFGFHGAAKKEAANGGPGNSVRS
jgi:putative phosphoserine phosphatase/1-acylglycerol-3-phosphate O-acyltransferase